jgi:hypothetical protein
LQFQKTFYRYVTTSVAPALVILGSDTAPTTVYGTNGAPPASPVANYIPATNATGNVDNILACRIIGSASQVAVTRIAAVMVGPTGAAAQNANLYVWDSGTQHWYLVNAAPVSMVQNQIVFFDAISLCEAPPNQPGGAPATQGGADYMLVVAAATPTAGQYAFSMSAILNVP